MLPCCTGILVNKTEFKIAIVQIIITHELVGHIYIMLTFSTQFNVQHTVYIVVFSRYRLLAT